MKKIKILNGALPHYLISVLLCWGVMLLLTFISSVAVYYTSDPLSYMWIGAILSTLLSAIISGIIISRFFAGGKLLYSASVSICVVFTMVVLSLILTGGKMTLGGAMNYLTYLGVFILSAYLGKGKRRRHK